MTSVSKNMCIDKLDDIINEYNNTYHSIIKMEPANIKSSTYTDLSIMIKFEVGDHVRISKHKNIFVKVYTPNWSEGVFVIKKFRNTFMGIYC